MAYYVLFAHLEKALVKKGEVLNGKQNVGIIGMSGNSTAKHLHLQVETELPKGYPEIRGFDQFAEPTNPSVVVDKYGKMCQNDVTQSYWNYWSGNSQELCGGHHTGIDYSGVIDKSYESEYCYTPSNAKCEVIAVGSDPLNLPHWGGYGNYVIIKILGKKEQKVSYKKKYSKATKLESHYNHPGKYTDSPWYLYELNSERYTYEVKSGKRSGTLPKGSKQIAFYGGTLDNGDKYALFFSNGKWHRFVTAEKI